MFVRSHISPRTHEPLDELSRQYIEEMRELAGIDEEGAQQSINDDIYKQVMPQELHGRMRTIGRGMTPTRFFGSQTSSSNPNGVHRIQQLENELAEMKRTGQEREEEMQQEIDEIRRQAQKKEEQMQEEFGQMKKSFETQTEDMQRSFGAQSKAMEERILQTLMQRTASFQNASKRQKTTNESLETWHR